MHGLVCLLHRGEAVSSEELSRSICTNPARVRKVMSKLHRAGLIEAGSGRGSGYSIKADGSRINLLEVLDALGEEVLVPGWHSGGPDKDCLISSGMGDVMDEVYGLLNTACREKLGGITLGMIEHRNFTGEKEAAPCGKSY